MPPNISIHALLTESDNLWDAHRVKVYNISIHALLTESDNFRCSIKRAISISIHALLTESDSGHCAP